jgi:hypothetical protein
MYEIDVTVSSKDALSDPHPVGAGPYINPVPNISEPNLRTGLQTLHGSIWSLHFLHPHKLNCDLDPEPDFEFVVRPDSDPAFHYDAEECIPHHEAHLFREPYYTVHVIYCI